jgi:4-hydroxybenzoate polyprenyltransferase
MITFFKFLFNEIFYNGHFQTWGSLAIVIFSGQLLNIKITWDLLLIVYLSFYLIYLHDRYRSLEVDFLTNPIRSKHIKSIYKYIPSILIIGLLILISLLYYFSNIYAAIFIILVTIFGFLYPLYFKGLTKKIIAFKNFYVSLVFSLLVILPNIYYQISLTRTTLLILLLLFIFTLLRGLMMQFFLDLKDIEGDKKEGLLTLGIVLGKEKVFKIINVINLFTSLSLPILYIAMPSLSLHPSILFLVFLAIWNFYFFSLAKNGNFFGFILGSGEFIYWPLFVYIGELILK